MSFPTAPSGAMVWRGRWKGAHPGVCLPLVPSLPLLHQEERHFEGDLFWKTPNYPEWVIFLKETRSGDPRSAWVPSNGASAGESGPGHTATGLSQSLGTNPCLPAHVEGGTVLHNICLCSMVRPTSMGPPAGLQEPHPPPGPLPGPSSSEHLEPPSLKVTGWRGGRAGIWEGKKKGGEGSSVVPRGQLAQNQHSCQLLAAGGKPAAP